MNSEQAKKLSLPDLLAKLGHTPTQIKKEGRELWYRSPFREERTPSLQVSMGRTGIWIWNDHGDTHGTVIDFVMRYRNFHQVKDALEFLEDIYQPNLFSAPIPQPPKSAATPAPDLFSFYQQEGREAAKNFSENRELEFIDARPLKHFVALKYLTEERFIPAELAQQYLALVRYRNSKTSKEYFGIGMKNQSGGFEVRSASSQQNFKSALLARDITIIPGAVAGRGTVHLFEGMMDFLSFLVLNGVESSPDDCVIMHSLTSFDRAVAYIRSQDYQAIKTYLDNDKAGQQGTERFKAEFGAMLLPQGEAFAPHHDLNAMLQAQRSGQKPSSNIRM